MEDMILPRAVLVYVAERTGKTISKRDSDNLEKKTGEKWIIHKEYGMCHLETQAYYMDSPGPKFSFLIDWNETNVIWPSAEDFIKRNTAYFKGAEERNAARERLLLEPLPASILNAAEAMVELASAMERMEVCTKSLEFGEMPDWSELKKKIFPERYLTGDRRMFESILP